VPIGGAVTKILTKVPRAGRALLPGLANASQQAYRAAQRINRWTPKDVHLAGAEGNRAKFAVGIDPRAEVAAALRRSDGLFLPNPNMPRSFRYVGNAGRVVGTRGQTRIRIIVKGGLVRNAFPVHAQ